jgi:hypothetical protein
LGEHRFRIHIQVTAFLLQHHQGMFAVRQQEVEKGSCRIKRIGQQQALYAPGAVPARKGHGQIPTGDRLVEV